MPTIRDSSTAIVSTHGSTSTGASAATYESIQDDIKNYWGTSPEKYYIIHSAELLEKIKESSANPKRVALRISNIDRAANLVNAEWISYKGSAATAALGNNDYYFVLDKDLADIEATFLLHPIDALIGRIAKNSNGVYYVFFNYARVEPKRGGGIGGDNASAGALIPPHP